MYWTIKINHCYQKQGNVYGVLFKWKKTIILFNFLAILVSNISRRTELTSGVVYVLLWLSLFTNVIQHIDIYTINNSSDHDTIYTINGYNTKNKHTNTQQKHNRYVYDMYALY